MHPRAAAGESFLHFLARGHARVARRGRSQRAVRRAVFNRLLRVVEFHETELHAGRKAVAAADAVKDFEAGILPALVEFPVVPENRAPVVLRGGDDVAQRGRGDLEIGELLHRRFDHRLESIRLDVPGRLLAFDRETERGREVFLVADHHVHILRNFAVHFLRLLETTDGFPERRAIVQIVADNRAVFLGGLDGLDGQFRRGSRERREDAAGVKPAHTDFAEDVIPINVAGLSCEAAVLPRSGIADRAADAKAAFGEIQTVADGAADAVVFAPFDEVRVHAALHDEVLDQMADFVVHKRGDHGGFVAETFVQAARSVVFAAAFHAVKCRAVRMRPSPGSRRSMTSPSEIWSYLQADLSRN